MFHTSVKSKTTMTFSTLVIAAVALLFASGPILGNQRALAANLCGSGLCNPSSGIHYPSPLSHFFGGDVLHHGGFHHFHGGSITTSSALGRIFLYYDEPPSCFWFRAYLNGRIPTQQLHHTIDLHIIRGKEMFYEVDIVIPVLTA